MELKTLFRQVSERLNEMFKDESAKLVVECFTLIICLIAIIMMCCCLPSCDIVKRSSASGTRSVTKTVTQTQEWTVPAENSTQKADN